MTTQYPAGLRPVCIAQDGFIGAGRGHEIGDRSESHSQLFASNRDIVAVYSRRRRNLGEVAATRADIPR